MVDRDREDNRERGQRDLTPLRALPNWQVSEGDIDIRGWDVSDADGNKVGQIRDLIINRRTGEAAYAEIAYGGNLGIGAKHTIIPIDELRVDANNKQVISNYPLEALKSAPEYREGSRDFGQFSGFWAGLAAAGISRRQPTEREERPGVMQRFAQRLEGRRTEPGGEATVPIEEAGEYVRRVRVHMAHRNASGDETPLNEGDVLEIPVRGEEQAATERPSMRDEIVIRLEAVEEEEEEEPERTHRFSR